MLFLATLILMNSCASKMYFTTLDTLKPAQVTFPPNVNNILIVNNSISQPANFGHYTTSLSGYAKSQSLQFDSAAIFITSALKDALKTKSFFNQVELSLTEQNIGNSFNYVNTLPEEQIRMLCKIYNADAVIALNNTFLTDDISEYYLNEENFYDELNVKVNTNWSIYYLDNKKDNIQFADSFLWHSQNYDRKMALDSLPKRYDALVDACILTGSNIADRMIPRWDKEDRYFFENKNELMTQAMDSVPYRKWSKAIELWNKAAETLKSNKIKYQAYNNIAAAYEIIGDIDKAIDYITKAVDTYSKGGTYSEKDGYFLISYQQILQARKKELKLLNQQLGN